MAYAIDTDLTAVDAPHGQGLDGQGLVLVVGRDQAFVAALLGELALQSMRGEAARPADAVAAVRSERPALVLVVIDPSETGSDAVAACSALRAVTAVPMLAVGTPQGSVDTVELLEVVDDVVPGRERLRESVARVRALLRRAPRPAPPDPRGGAGSGGGADEVIEVGDVSLDVERHVVTVRGERVHLPLKQFLLLEVLLRNAGQVLPKLTLEERVWGGAAVVSNTLEVQVKRLRGVVERDPSSPELIRTVRGLGYVFERPGRGRRPR